MKKECGITAIKLILIMVLIIGIISAGVGIFWKIWKTNTVKDIKTDLLYVQAKCKLINDKHTINSEEKLLGEPINEYTENPYINSIVSESEGWYKLSQEDLNEMHAEHLKAEDGYIVNYEEEDVIYVKGIEENDTIYYKLSEVVKDEENIDGDDKKAENGELDNINEENVDNEENSENEGTNE